MNKNNEKLLEQNFRWFLELIELGVIDKEIGMKAVINSRYAPFICDFANFVKDTDVEKLTDAIIKTQNVYYIYLFARDIEDSNKKRLIDEIEKIEINDKTKKTKKTILEKSEFITLMLLSKIKNM